ncbi:hypothetical protein [Sinomonas sp. ASV322]|uniref:hypothetical protein n=1 Tax=Sinomonas sp. ASV322 TaxID=3041920 RepID=UPI0027DB3362|nr:hypothetical protein [Sinomonas sp. ASV322]MDQ4504188.1 hypothetical protein [Sinomonas sp. ASV322]
MTALTAADVAVEHAELLPQRDTMLFDINVAPVVAVNLAIAVNAATIGSTANATALQMVGVLQH